MTNSTFSPARRLVSAFAVAAVALLAGCSSSASGHDQPASGAKPTFPAGTTMAKLAARGSITVGIKEDQPLEGLMGLDGKPTGFDVDIATLIAGALGIPASNIKWVETPSKVREQYIEQGRVDLLIATYTITPTRLKEITMAGPYYEPGEGLMAPKGGKVTSLASLKDPSVKVCAGVGSSGANLIVPYLANAGSQLVQFDDLSKCGQALKTGQVAAVTADTGILDGLAYSLKGDYAIIGKPYAPNDYGIGMKKGDVTFCNFIDNLLTKSYADGTFQHAWNDTLGKVQPSVPVLPKFIPCK